MDLVRTILATAVVAALVAGCGGGQARYGPDSEQAYAASTLTRATPPSLEVEEEEEEPRGALVATAAVSRVKVFREPGDERPFVIFEHPNTFGTPRVFLVREESEDWIRVLLPMEPNGSEGWVRARDVELAPNPYRVEVDLGAKELRAFRGDRELLHAPVAIGTPETPTPTGLFFTTILVRPEEPDSPYGKFAFGLSGYSEVLTTFAGGDGQIAIHGTNQPSAIGTPASHGCVRVDNATITRLARTLPLGTPVRIHP